MPSREISATEQIRRTIERRLDCEVRAITPTAGGDINEAYRVDTDLGDLFVKTRPGAAPGTYSTEAAGLEWLAEPGALGVPRVRLVHDPDEADAGPGMTRFLALDWIDRGPPTPASEEELGRGLAAVHAAGASSYGVSPSGSPTRFGEIVLPNDPASTFAEFWATCRLLPLAEQGARSLGAAGVALIHRVAERLPTLVGPPEPPARTHGDLWSGNVLHGAGGSVHLIDPAAHGGHREVDLATLRVFGGPGDRCFAAYDEARPLADGWQDRIELWQLEVVLLHVALFGGTYAGQATALASRYV